VIGESACLSPSVSSACTRGLALQARLGEPTGTSTSSLFVERRPASSSDCRQQSTSFLWRPASSTPDEIEDVLLSGCHSAMFASRFSRVARRAALLLPVASRHSRKRPLWQHAPTSRRLIGGGGNYPQVPIPASKPLVNASTRVRLPALKQLLGDLQARPRCGMVAVDRRATSAVCASRCCLGGMPCTCPRLTAPLAGTTGGGAGARSRSVTRSGSGPTLREAARPACWPSRSSGCSA